MQDADLLDDIVRMIFRKVAEFDITSSRRTAAYSFDLDHSDGKFQVGRGKSAPRTTMYPPADEMEPPHVKKETISI